MAALKRTKAVANISELRFKLAEKFAALENGEISVSEAKAFAGIASAIVNTCKLEMINNSTNGITKEIDFLGEINNPAPTPKMRTEYFEPSRTDTTERPDEKALVNYFCELRLDFPRAQQEATRFLDYFDSNGWVVGQSKAPMKDWKAGARSWVYRMNNYTKPATNGNYQPLMKQGTSDARLRTAKEW